MLLKMQQMFSQYTACNVHNLFVLNVLQSQLLMIC